MRVIRTYIGNVMRVCLLAKRGKKYAHCVKVEPDGLYRIGIPLRDADKASDAIYKGKPYTEKQARDKYVQLAKERGCTKAVADLLGIKKPKHPTGFKPMQRQPSLTTQKPDPVTVTHDAEPDLSREGEQDSIDMDRLLDELTE